MDNQGFPSKKKEDSLYFIIDFLMNCSPLDNKNNELESRNEKRDKYFDLSREQKMLWNMKVTVMPFVIGTLGTVCLVWRLEELEIKEQSKTIQTTGLLRSASILKKVLETRGNLLSFRL